MSIRGKEQILQEIFEVLRSSIEENFPKFLYKTNVTVSKNGTFYVMITKKRGKVLGEQQQQQQKFV